MEKIEVSYKEALRVCLFLLIVTFFVTAGFLVYSNPIEAFSIKYVGWFNSYYYSDFFAFAILGMVLLPTYRRELCFISNIINREKKVVS